MLLAPEERCKSHLAGGTGRGIQFWDKSTPGVYSSFSLSVPSKAVVALWALQSCAAAAPGGSGWDFGNLQLQGFWGVKFCMESVMGR